MILAFDTYYWADKAKTACVAFVNWTDETPSAVYIETIANVNDYEAGAFYKRELPCIISLLAQIEMANIEAIVVDSFVVLDDVGKLGLGGYLYEYLAQKIPVIGVAKTNFASLHQSKIALLRGGSARPLYITAAGIDLDLAAQHIKNMAGEHRIPMMLKQLDILTKKM
jgi:deoxyribonuclease V